MFGFASAAVAQGDAADAAPAATGPGSVVRETHGAWQVGAPRPLARRKKNARSCKA